MCYPDAGIVDDLLVYRFPDHLMLVVNASNIEKDLQWICEHVEGDVQVENESDGTALIAVQGPSSERFLQQLTDADLSAIAYYHFVTDTVAGVSAIISRTGYTGEDGFEIYVDAPHASAVWDALLAAGTPDGLRLIGLGARDTLRLEAGYMLYGNDIDKTTSPLEAGLGWTVKFGEHDFIARDVLERQKADGVSRRIVQMEMLDRGIPRPHYPVWSGSVEVGALTSGTFSPTFNKGIAMGYVARDAARAGTEIDVEIRRERHPARVVKKPMYKREGA
jgi:aminomethyltransferase